VRRSALKHRQRKANVDPQIKDIRAATQPSEQWHNEIVTKTTSSRVVEES